MAGADLLHPYGNLTEMRATVEAWRDVIYADGGSFPVSASVPAFDAIGL
jgi:hypothetical protein